MSRIARTIYDSMLLTLAPLCFAGDGPSGGVSVGGSSGELDFEHLELCLAGPGFDLSPGCYPYDLDADDDCDLRDVWDVQHVLCGPELLVYTIGDENDDGTETIPRRWDSDGYGADGWNRLGTSNPELYLAGLRFRLPDVQPGEDFVYARLLLPGGHAAPAGVVRLRVYGVDDDSASEFHLAPPSLQPHTDQSVYWEEPGPWPAGATDCVPLWRPSPNLAPVVNAVINRPQWGAGAGGRVLGLLIEPDLAAGEGYLMFRDFVADPADCSGGPAGARLELYRTVRSTFLGRELLGRPTDHSVTINALSLLTLHVYAEYGTSPGVYSAQTPVGVYPGGEPIEFTLSGLSPATRYYYRLRYRRPDESTFESGPEHTFRTQADTGESFRFAVIADPHVLRSRLSDLHLRRRLYETTLTNIAAEQPDFFLDLGDSMNSEEYDSRDALDALEAVRRHLDQRPMLDLVAHSAPYFLALGNHEGEQGWRLDGTPDNLAVWATLARKLVYPLPTSDGFYTGNSLLEPFVGLRENYYAWRWGPALFIVLDPFWSTTTKPHDQPLGEPPGSGDNWDWTLGHAQYSWLAQTLALSNISFKFVFIHHLTAGLNTYGRGGIEAVRHELGGCGSFEWGGEDLDGRYVFPRKRPGWPVPVHNLLVDHDATIVFHGHDHLFVHQELDGIVYQECPMPSDPSYGYGHISHLYTHGEQRPNSGHLRVTVWPTRVRVDYVRAFLPGDGDNGSVEYSYEVLIR